jgi:DNA-binding SARP family transcriptional activator
MFELVIDGDRVTLPLRAQRVLGYLAVVQPAQSRSVLAGLLWGGAPQDRAMAILRNALWQLRKTSAPLVHTSRDEVRIDADVCVDLACARRCANGIVSGTSAVTASPEGADPLMIDMLDADLLGGWEEDWLHIERERLRQLRIHALETLADSLTRAGRYAEAIQAALAAVRAEPLRETAQIVLITAYLAEGNVCEAVRQFESFRRLLADELGIAPSAQVTSLLPAVGRGIG